MYYYTLAKSLVFGARNDHKVRMNNDKGRVFAEVGQFTNAAKAAAKLDNLVGKGTKAAIGAMCKLSEGNKALEVVGKGVDWTSKNVNPLLVGAAGYRVLTSDDKEKAFKRELYGMTTMFGAEAAMKSYFNSSSHKDMISNIKKPASKAVVGILQGVAFVIGSVTASIVGYKIGDFITSLEHKKNNNTKIDAKDFVNKVKSQAALVEKEKTAFNNHSFIA